MYGQLAVRSPSSLQDALMPWSIPKGSPGMQSVLVGLRLHRLTRSDICPVPTGEREGVFGPSLAGSGRS